MHQRQQPIPANELDRLLSLSSYDVDYTSIEDNFKDLTELAARVAGTEISLINLIDTYTQWSVAKHGIDLEQMPREDSVCQYVVMDGSNLEVLDLSEDERFKYKDYVKGPLNLRYYYGIPLRTNTGHNIGALCVLDTEKKKISPEKVELLQLISKEIMSRLQTLKLLEDLKTKVSEYKETNKRVAHDIRGPLAGIIGISEIISEQGDANKLDEVLDFVNLIHKSSKSILDLADEILTDEQKAEVKPDKFNLGIFKEKLQKLYGVQAMNKNIALNLNVSPAQEAIAISKDKLLQIVGNLISNAIKFTPSKGVIDVDMQLKIDALPMILTIVVSDTGEGMTAATIQQILSGQQQTTSGTGGEIGYGFGLSMVKHLVETLNGTMQIESDPGKGTSFEIKLPQDRLAKS